MWISEPGNRSEKLHPMVTVGLWLLNTSVGKYSLQSLPAIQVEDLVTGFTFLLNLPGFKNRGSIICLVYLKKKKVRRCLKTWLPEVRLATCQSLREVLPRK